MSFLKVGVIPKAIRRLYLMRMELPSGMIVHKIGVASGSSAKERMLQINGSIFDKFRETAKIKIVRDRKIDADLVFKYETCLHHYFADYQYVTNHKFDGVTECFTLPNDSADAVQAYEAVIDGQVPDHVYELREVEGGELPF